MITNEFSWKSSAGWDVFGREWAPEGETRAAIGLVHGLGEHSGRYHHVAKVLSGAGYALMGIDLPGHGRSGSSRGFTSFDEISTEIDRLLARAKKQYPDKPLFLYGHSMGGALVLYYVLKCRPGLQGAIVTGPGLAAGRPVPAWKLLIARVMARAMPSLSLSNGLDRENLSRDPLVVKAYQKDPLVHDRVSLRLGLDLLTLGNWILERARDFPVPLLLMQGSADHIVSTPAVQKLAGLVPADKLTYNVWEGLYHEIHNDPDQAQIIQAMRDWLDRQV